MRRRLPLFTGIGLLAILLASVATGLAEAREPDLKAFRGLPLRFEHNAGQTDERVKFLAHGAGYTLFLTPAETVLVLQPPQAVTGRATPVSVAALEAARSAPGVIRMALPGAAAVPRLVGREELPGKANYFIGRDPSRWRTNVATYGKVEYRSIYPGVDLVYYGREGALEFDFVLAPGADPSAIRLAFSGADRLDVDERGDVALGTPAGPLRMHRPMVYQEIDGRRVPVDARFVRRGCKPGACAATRHVLGVEVAAYDRTRPLTIDPVLSYSTYLGGTSGDVANAIAVDGSGNVYVAGFTSSTDFPTTAGAYRMTLNTSGGGTNAFVAKLDASGSTLAYATYLGGGNDNATAIAVDGSGNAYVGGWTSTNFFPTTAGVLSTSLGGSQDGFVTKLNSTGSALVYSTFLGGAGNDQVNGIAVDGSGNTYVAGWTASADFPKVAPQQAVYGGGATDAFVSKLNSTGTALVYSTYLGGGGDDQANAIAVDSAGHAYVAGHTKSADFPTLNPYQAARNGAQDAFVAKYDAPGTLYYSTYFGGTDIDQANAIAVDGTGNAWFAGQTQSSAGFPTAGPIQGSFGGGTQDAFVAKLNITGVGSTLVYSTYLGGSGDDWATAIAIDASGDAFVAGVTGSSNFPVSNAIQSTFGAGTWDGFVAKINIPGSSLVYSTYLGGSSLDMAEAIAVGGSGNAYVAGHTQSTDFPTASPFQSSHNGAGNDAFIAKIATPAADVGIAVVSAPTALAPSGTVVYAVTVTNNGPGTATGVTVTDTLPAGVTFGFASPSQGTCAGSAPITCTLGTMASGAQAAVKIIAQAPGATGTVTNTVNVAGNEDTNSSNNSASASTTVRAASADVAVSITALAGPVPAGTNFPYTVTVTNNGPDPASGIVVSVPTPAGSTFVSFSPSEGSCNSLTMTCSLGSTLAPGARMVVRMVVTPTTTGTLTTTASASAATSDAVSTNNSASAATTVRARSADLVATLTAQPQTLAVGDSLEYVLTVRNLGPDPAASVVLTASLPASLLGISSTVRRSSCSGTTTVTCNLGTLASGTAFRVHTTATPSAAGALTTSVSVSSSTADPVAANNSASATVQVGSGTLTGTVAITVTSSTGTAIAGASVTQAGGATLTTNASGLATFTGVPAGSPVAFSASANGFLSGSTTVTPVGVSTTSATISLAPFSSTAALFRIVLNWGAQPRDLDGHLTGPNPPAGATRFHIYYANKNVTVAGGVPGPTDSTIPFQDQDITQGFGPETIEIQSTAQRAGLYRYSVHHYAGTGTLCDATNNPSISVRLYQGNTLLQTFTPPTAGCVDGVNNLWTVFTLTINADGTFSVASVNTYSGPVASGGVTKPRADVEDPALFRNLPAKP